MEWPSTAQGYLSFIAQVNLGEMPKLSGSPLPPEGLLQFFLASDESADEIEFSLCYHGWTDSLTEPDTPDEEEFAEHNYANLLSHRIETVIGTDLPSYGSEFFDEAERLCRGHEDRTSDRLFQLIDDVRGIGEGRTVVGKLLGHSTELNHDLRLAAELSSLGRPRLIHHTHKSLHEIDRELEAAIEPNREYWRRIHRDLAWFRANEEMVSAALPFWRLLWEIHSDPESGLEIWDRGMFSVLIHDRDLLTRDFSNAYAEIESS